jgi:hypothetical protein
MHIYKYAKIFIAVFIPKFLRIRNIWHIGNKRENDSPVVQSGLKSLEPELKVTMGNYFNYK